MSTKPPLTHRATSTSSTTLVKPQSKIHPSATVADKAQLIGPHVIEIGERVVIHPQARIKAEHGNVVIGNGSIISEKAVVGWSAAPDDDGENLTSISVGEGVSIEGGAVIEGRRIGDHSTIEVNARINRGAIVGKWCKIGPMCEVKDDEILDDFTVVYGYGQKRIDVVCRDEKDIRELRIKGREMEVDLLKTLITDTSFK